MPALNSRSRIGVGLLKSEFRAQISVEAPRRL
jgi:hypothetical protein